MGESATRGDIIVIFSSSDSDTPLLTALCVRCRDVFVKFFALFFEEEATELSEATENPFFPSSEQDCDGRAVKLFFLP